MSSKIMLIRILVVDDHQIVSAGLRLMLGRETDLEVVGEAGNRTTALLLAEQLCPDLIVMDIGLPDSDGIALSKEILMRWPAMRIVIFSGSADPARLEAAIEAGVSGYVLKSCEASTLVRAIRAAVGKQTTYFCPQVAFLLTESYKRMLKTGGGQGQPTLSERELQVLRMIAAGRNTKAIAAELELSVKTIETHRIRIMDKVGLHSVAELTKHAIRMGYTAI